MEVHSPVLKHVTCINQYSGILGTKTITLSPDVMLATVHSTFAALVIDKLKLIFVTANSFILQLGARLTLTEKWHAKLPQLNTTSVRTACAQLYDWFW